MNLFRAILLYGWSKKNFILVIANRQLLQRNFWAMLNILGCLPDMWLDLTEILCQTFWNPTGLAQHVRHILSSLLALGRLIFFTGIQVRPFKINCAFLVPSLLPFPMSKWKTHTKYVMEKCYFSAYGDGNVFLLTRHVPRIFNPQREILWNMKSNAFLS